MKTIGLIVNPIAGMGGSVGLKGTDGEMIAQARRLGAQPVTPQRAATFLAEISHQSDIAWLAPPGKMGADFLTALSLPFLLFFIMRFVFPGLKRNERSIIVFCLVASTLLFAGGVFMAYAATLEIAIEVLQHVVVTGQCRFPSVFLIG